MTEKSPGSEVTCFQQFCNASLKCDFTFFSFQVGLSSHDIAGLSGLQKTHGRHPVAPLAGKKGTGSKVTRITFSAIYIGVFIGLECPLEIYRS